MPARVANVRWKCAQCGKSRWRKPADAAAHRFCSRTCYWVSRRVENPVRPKLANVVVRYGTRSCEECGTEFEAKTKIQRFCSQPCVTKNIQARRRGQPINPRPCEYCATVFTPRQGSAGRFCSWDCKNKGQRGAKASGWRGGRHTTDEGYVRVHAPDHPKAQGHGGYVSEHRLVMEGILGRHIQDHETVHHINGNKADNRPENLQLRSGRHGKGVVHRCADCGSYNIVNESLAVI